MLFGGRISENYWCGSRRTGETVRFLAGHTDWVTAVAITCDAHTAVSASADRDAPGMGFG